MKSFYELSSDTTEIPPQAAAESPGGVERVVDLLSSIPWGHMRLIVDKRNGDTDKVTFCACKSFGKVEVQYALESTGQPVSVGGNGLSRLIPEDFKGSLPTLEKIAVELGGVLWASAQIGTSAI